MKPLPADEQNPLAGGADRRRSDPVAGLQGSEGHDRFDAGTPPKAKTDKN